MAATRKLQGEIDRCLKKVTEGVETFDDIWQKVHNATNSNQKEKYEADLKKEIKKLQRLRDQIKSWIASAEIKDKTSLLDNRRLIETQMERFKVVERETKTKAYSKEGLGAAQKLDPSQREKENVSCWLQNSISSLQIQTDQFESEIESLIAGKKKKLDKEKQEKMDDLKGKLERHKFHITKLETLLRMLDNDSVNIDQIKKIHDDVEYYIESSQEPDFEENEYIYDDIDGLDEVELSGLPSAATESNNSNDTGGSPTSTTSTSPINSPALNCSAPTTTTLNATMKHNHSGSGSTSVDYSDVKKNKTLENSIIKPVVKPTAVRAKTENSLPTSTVLSLNSSNTIINNNNNISSAASVAASQNTSIMSKPLISSTPSKNHQPSAAQILAQNNSNNNNSIQSPSTILPTAPIAFSAVAKQNPSTLENGPIPMVLSGQSSAPLPAPSLSNINNLTSVGNLQSQQHSASAVHNNTNSSNVAIENHMNNNSSSLSNCVSPTSNQSAAVSGRTSPSSLMSPQQQQQQQQILNGPAANVKQQQNPSSQANAVLIGMSGITNMKPSGTNEALIPPLLGVAPLGPTPLQKDHQVQFQMMEAAYYHLPSPSDSERLRPYLQRQAIATPPHFPQTQLPHSDTIDFFQRLATETLFFVFYYMEGTKAQYLAAKALKKQSWRFHTKYMMWFQRHEEPKIINEEFEQGTYIYFDYEKWGQRKKEGFTFEYKYLEDKDLN
ncbi:CLUMA_CG004485, isoform A [Clunio marinus]|uniref:CCR4-NOT transcription complex subunit 3 n=1 Tax=Clunio marinus TaxID=568069 RepID=A0A1J1HS38_9DIPT|nr:CLUMA_CG004485, isoform A [Clunio marinus]